MSMIETTNLAELRSRTFWRLSRDVRIAIAEGADLEELAYDAEVLQECAEDAALKKAYADLCQVIDAARAAGDAERKVRG